MLVVRMLVAAMDGHAETGVGVLQVTGVSRKSVIHVETAR